MEKKPINQQIRDYLAGIGSEGGKAQVTKGIGSLTEDRKREIAMKGVEARRAKKAAANKAETKKAAKKGAKAK